jgi:hypothetical protein
VFGLPGELVVTIPDRAAFYSLYAEGNHCRKIYLPESGETLLAYPRGAAVILYYTYPAHRAASVIRNDPGQAALPGLSKKVRVLFTVHASGVDKLKRAAAFLHKHAPDENRTDDFYTRLYFALLRRGKLNYPSLRRLAAGESSEA